MPDNGFSSIADIFNRIHHDKNESVSKTENAFLPS